jgi:hypothetical protein
MGTLVDVALLGTCCCMAYLVVGRDVRLKSLLRPLASLLFFIGGLGVVLVAFGTALPIIIVGLVVGSVAAISIYRQVDFCRACGAIRKGSWNPLKLVPDSLKGTPCPKCGAIAE